MPLSPLQAAVSASLRIAVQLRRLSRNFEQVAEGVALNVLRDEELHALTVRCYRSAPPSTGRGLFGWEREWLQRDLPAAPCRVLLGGAGMGRELPWLLEQGYEVVAFDPLPTASAEILELGYEDLADGPRSPSRAEALERLMQRGPYGAVLLGWGSFTHLAGAQRRGRLLRVLRSLCEGPLLMSFMGWSAGLGPQRGGRGVSLGRRLGRAVRPDAGVEPRQGDMVMCHAGYAHVFSPSEIEELARSAGYEAQSWFLGYGHATLRPVREGRS